MARPLAGVRVLDMGTFITGPCCAMMLADIFCSKSDSAGREKTSLHTNNQRFAPASFESCPPILIARSRCPSFLSPMITGDLKDAATVNTAGESVTPLPVGVSFRPAPTQFDDRGSVCELYDPRWGWHAAEALGAELTLPPQYARAGVKLWPGRKLAQAAE